MAGRLVQHLGNVVGLGVARERIEVRLELGGQAVAVARLERPQVVDLAAQLVALALERAEQLGAALVDLTLQGLGLRPQFDGERVGGRLRLGFDLFGP